MDKVTSYSVTVESTSGFYEREIYSTGSLASVMTLATNMIYHEVCGNEIAAWNDSDLEITSISIVKRDCG